MPQLNFATPRRRKVVSARHASVGSKYQQSSYRSLVRDSGRKEASNSPPKPGASVAANVAAGRNSRPMKHRYQPTVEEIAKALQERPYLTAQIVALRDDSTLDKASRLTEIGKIVRECEAPVQASELEAQQANYRPPRDRLAGRRAAHTQFNAYVKQHVTPVKPPDTHTPHWAAHGGEELANLLTYVDLIDARYLIALNEQGGSLPCWGALPASAKITRDDCWRLYGWETRGCLGVLAISYPWLDYDHPDAHGETLSKVVHVLQSMLPLSGGPQHTVGVLIDYGSVPQPARSHAELTRFKLGLRALAQWYAHPYVPVLLVTGSLPTVRAPSSPAPRAARRMSDRRRWRGIFRPGWLTGCRVCAFSHPAPLPVTLPVNLPAAPPAGRAIYQHPTRRGARLVRVRASAVLSGQEPLVLLGH